MFKRILVTSTVAAGTLSFAGTAQAVELVAESCQASVAVTFHNVTDGPGVRKYVVVRQSPRSGMSVQTYKVVLPAHSDLTVHVPVPASQSATVFARNRSLTVSNSTIGCASR